MKKHYKVIIAHKSNINGDFLAVSLKKVKMNKVFLIYPVDYEFVTPGFVIF